MRRIVIALFATLAATPALAAPETVATPAGPWEASFEGGICRMQRAFEAGGQPHLLILEQNAPGRAVGIALAGPSLAGLDAAAPLRVTLAAGDDGFDKAARIEPNRQFGHVAVLTGVWLAEGVDAEGSNPGRIDTGAAQYVERIAVSQGGKSVAFATGSLTDAAEALNGCTAQIMRSWGLDPAQQYGLTQGVSTDEVKVSYPRIAARARRSGPVQVAVIVDAKGTPTDCRVLSSSGQADIDAAACEGLTKARYEPARDAQGQKVASFWTTRVNFFASEYEKQTRRP